MRWSTSFTVTVAAYLLAATVPAGSGQPAVAARADVTFYGHVFGSTLNSPMPANTEAPRGEANYGLGATNVCTNASPVPPPADPTGELPPVVGDCQTGGLAKLALFSTAGFVDVKDRDEFARNGRYALFHNERGQTKDIVLDTAGRVTARVYLTVDFHSWFVSTGETACLAPHPRDVPCLYPYWGWDPGTLPDVVVDVALYSARLGDHGGNASDTPPILQTLESGGAAAVAHGRWGPAQVMNGLPGAPNVNQFDVDLGAPLVSSIPREHDFFLVYSVYVENGGKNVETGQVRWWSGEFFPPTFTLPVQNAIDVERVIPQFAHGKVAILGVVNTPWGSYDVARDGVVLTITDAAGRPVEPRHIERYGKFSVGHGGHYLPINFTWVWNHHADRLAPGTYTATIAAANYQRSAVATCSATFTLLPPEREGALARPGPVTEGSCGAQSASDEAVDALAREAGAGTPGGRNLLQPCVMLRPHSGGPRPCES